MQKQEIIIPLNIGVKSLRKQPNVLQETIVQLRSRIVYLEQLLLDKVSSKITVSTMEGMIIIDTKEIIFIQASSNYSTIHTNDGNKLLTSKSLKYFTQLIGGHSFLRIHASYYVNVEYMKKYLRKENQLVLKNGKAIPISKGRKEIMDDWINKINQ